MRAAEQEVFLALAQLGKRLLLGGEDTPHNEAALQLFFDIVNDQHVKRMMRLDVAVLQGLTGRGVAHQPITIVQMVPSFCKVHDLDVELLRKLQELSEQELGGWRSAREKQSIRDCDWPTAVTSFEFGDDNEWRAWMGAWTSQECWRPWREARRIQAIFRGWYWRIYTMYNPHTDVGKRFLKREAQRACADA